jgi:hypothetical protein
MSALIQSYSAIAGRSAALTTPDELSLVLGLDKRIHDEKQKLIALTNPEEYITLRLAAEESVKGIAYQTYNSLYDRYELLSLPKEMCDLRARRGAAAIAQVEMAAIEEQYPSISAKSIVTADSGKALRATRKARVSETKQNLAFEHGAAGYWQDFKQNF